MTFETLSLLLDKKKYRNFVVSLLFFPGSSHLSTLSFNQGKKNAKNLYYLSVGIQQTAESSFFSSVTAGTTCDSVRVCVCICGTERIILMNSFLHLQFFTKQADNGTPWKERVD